MGNYKEPEVSSYAVADEGYSTEDDRLGGKRGVKPFYKQTWFLWSESGIYISNETFTDSGWGI